MSVFATDGIRRDGDRKATRTAVVVGPHGGTLGAIEENDRFGRWLSAPGEEGFRIGITRKCAGRESSHIGRSVEHELIGPRRGQDDCLHAAHVARNCGQEQAGCFGGPAPGQLRGAVAPTADRAVAEPGERSDRSEDSHDQRSA